VEPDLRAESAAGLADIGFHGYAIGGLAVGEGQDLMLQTIEATAPLLPEDRPRYLMGVGTPDDIVESVARGIDMFDCVMPTRSGRHGQAFTRFGRLNLRNAKHAEDMRPLDETSDCPALASYSRAYLHHLVKSGEILGMMIVSWANLAYYQSLMSGIREAIAKGNFEDFRGRTREAWERGGPG
jgi:queuine tRNA-ribosyltransferase